MFGHKKPKLSCITHYSTTEPPTWSEGNHKSYSFIYPKRGARPVLQGWGWNSGLWALGTGMRDMWRTTGAASVKVVLWRPLMESVPRTRLACPDKTWNAFKCSSQLRLNTSKATRCVWQRVELSGWGFLWFGEPLGNYVRQTLRTWADQINSKVGIKNRIVIKLGKGNKKDSRWRRQLALPLIHFTYIYEK